MYYGVVFYDVTVSALEDWVVSATTIYCEAVDDEVTLIINIDGTSQCTGYRKYFKPDKATAEIMRKKSRAGKALRCEGLECPRVSGYRDSLPGLQK